MSERVEDFWDRYGRFCFEAQICPLRSVIKKLNGTELCTPVEAIRYEHWDCVLKALSIDNSLTKVHFVSFLTPSDNGADKGKKKKRRERGFPIPYGRTAINITYICEAVSSLLEVSKTLKYLKLENLLLKPEDAENLSEGLKNANLEYFSLARCKLGDDIIESICHGLYLSKIDWIDFSSCGLSMKGVTSICNIIKAHKIRRGSEMFRETLRQQFPVLDAQKGFKRVTLNDNPMYDKGIGILSECLSDDLWIKALDLQKCGIGNEGAMLLLQIAKVSPQMQIIDLRLNDVDNHILERLSRQLELNKAGKILEFDLLPLWESIKVVRKSRKQHSSKVKIKVVTHSTLPKPNKHETKSDGCTVQVSAEDTDKVDVASQTSNDMDGLKMPDGNILNEIIKLKKAYNSERKMHQYFKDLLIKSQIENHNLRKTLVEISNPENQIIIDQETFLLVQNTFEKLETFLHTMKEHGLWDYVQMYDVGETADVVLERNSDSRKFMKVIEKTSHCASSTSKSNNGKPFQYNKQANFCSCRKADCTQVQDSVEGIQNTTNSCPNQSSMNKTVFQTKTKSELTDKAVVQRIYKEAFEHYSNRPSNRQGCCTKPSAHKTDGLPANMHGKAQRLHLHFAKLPVDYSEVTKPQENIASTPYSYNKFKKLHGMKQTDPVVEASAIENLSTKLNDIAFNNKKNIISPQLKVPSTLKESHFSTKSHKIQKPTSLKERNSSFSSSWAKQKKIKRMHMKEIDSSSSSSDSDDSSARSEIKFPLKQKQHSAMKPCQQFKQDLEVKNMTSSSDSVSDKFASTGLSTNPHSHSSSLSERDTSKPRSTTSKMIEGEGSSRTIAHFRLPTGEKVEVIKSSVSSEGSLNKVVSNSSLMNAKNVSSRSSVKNASISKRVKRKSCSSSSSEMEEETPKSYLESVSDASTDKDVKSFSEMEVSLDSSVKINPKHSDDGTSVHSSKSETIQKGNLSQSVLSGAKYSGDRHKMHSNKLEGIQKESISQMSTIRTTAANQAAPEIITNKKQDPTDSSIPSLSDITTVSSHSLNTDSVMQQLSEGEKTFT